MTEEVIDTAAATTTAADTSATAAATTTTAAATTTAASTTSTTASLGKTASEVAADATKADTKTTPASKWSDTWRLDMAGSLAETASEEEKAEHTKLLKRLERFNTPADAARALREQDKLIASGAHKKPLAKNATPEQIAKWREENGIPDAPDKYDLGVKTEELAPMSAKFLSLMAQQAHAANASPDVVKAIAAAVPQFEQAMAQEVEVKNEEAKRETIEELRSEWGPDYRANMDGLLSWLNSRDSAASEALINARVDGVQLLNIPAVTRALAAHARELGFVGATVVPSGGDLGKSIEDEIATIEKSMFNENGTKNPAYWNSDKQIERYSQLLETKKRRESK